MAASKPRERHGKYKVLRHPKGGATIWGPGIRENGAYVRSDDSLRQDYDPNKSWTKQRGSLRVQTRLRAILEEPHKPSMINGRAAVGIPHPKINEAIPRTQIQEAIRSFWPEEAVERFFQGDDEAVKGILDFARAHYPEYHSAHRAKSHGSLRSVMDSVYPGLYLRLRGQVDVDSIDEKDLAEELLRRFISGESISSTDLKDSPRLQDRLLRRQVLALGKNHLFDRGDSYTSKVAQLTGLSQRNIRIDPGARKDLGTIAELITRLLCTWAPIVGVDLEGRIGTELIYGNGERSRIRDRDSEPLTDSREGTHADLRVGNQAIEVKSGIGHFTPSYAADIVAKYDPTKVIWNSGEPLSASSAVFFMRPDRYKGAVDALKGASIDVIPHNWINGKMRELVKRMAPHTAAITRSVSPRVHTLNPLMRLSEEVALRPAVITRESNSEERVWAKQALTGLVAYGERLRSADSPEPSDRKDVAEVAGGEVRSYKGDSFLYIARPLSQMDAGPLGKYILENSSAVTLARLRERFPGLPLGVAKSRFGFVDIETAGLKATSPIFSISLTTYDDELTTECFVARDPSEERAAIGSALERIHEQDAVFTFNGTSFDLPRLTERSRQQGLLLKHGRARSLTEALGNRHVDLYKPLRSRLPKTHDCQLKTFEKIIVQAPRKGDISGERIPRIYRSYVDGDDSAYDFSRVIRHNMLDTVSEVGVMTYLCLDRK